MKFYTIWIVVAITIVLFGILIVLASCGCHTCDGSDPGKPIKNKSAKIADAEKTEMSKISRAYVGSSRL